MLFHLFFIFIFCWWWSWWWYKVNAYMFQCCKSGGGFPASRTHLSSFFILHYFILHSWCCSHVILYLFIFVKFHFLLGFLLFLLVSDNLSEKCHKKLICFLMDAQKRRNICNSLLFSFFSVEKCISLTLATFLWSFGKNSVFLKKIQGILKKLSREKHWY